MSLAIEMAARAWCTPATENKVMDPELCSAFADILEEVLSKPWLGNATTEELLDELKARIEMEGLLGYKTVNIDG